MFAQPVQQGGNMEDSANVSIRQIENGYIFDRSWQEGKGKDQKYCNEQYFVKSLPDELQGLMAKGYMKNAKKNRYEKMASDMNDYSESQKPKKKVAEKKEEKSKLKSFFGKNK